jgi:hypothetical protein
LSVLAIGNTNPLLVDFQLVKAEEEDVVVGMIENVVEACSVKRILSRTEDILLAQEVMGVKDIT